MAEPKEGMDTPASWDEPMKLSAKQGPEDGGITVTVENSKANPVATVPADSPCDPWQHRSDAMKCKTCMYCAPKRPPMNLVVQRPVGRCRRHAPTMNGYPVVFVLEDWCGDHKLDETKV